jgi:hypothetical protein
MTLGIRQSFDCLFPYKFSNSVDAPTVIYCLNERHGIVLRGRNARNILVSKSQ